MRKLVICGSSAGFEKVRFTQLFQAELGYSLKTAKKNTDAVLDGQPVFIEVPDERYKEMACRLIGLGAIVALDE